MTAPWVHMPDGRQGVWWGPFADHSVAELFADFVTAEIDPAHVDPGPPPGLPSPDLSPRTVADGVTVHDPVHELLAWRDMITSRDGQVPR